MNGTFEKDKPITTVSEQYERMANNALKVMIDYVQMDEYTQLGDKTFHLTDQQRSAYLSFHAAQANTYATLALAAAFAQAVDQR
jgi:hypothetical protein